MLFVRSGPLCHRYVALPLPPFSYQAGKSACFLQMCIVEIPKGLPVPLNFGLRSYTLFLLALLFVVVLVFHLSCTRHFSVPLKTLVWCEQKCHCYYFEEFPFEFSSLLKS
ncbi:UNVERIFIED_CONTAM: hypothetical protein K2H54_056623 [Gekko kuhli]